MGRMLSFTKAIREAQDIEMARDPRVFICGEDVGVYGTAFGQTQGLLAKYGPMRVVDAPLSETAITGLGVGAAAVGLRPIIVHDFMDFMGVCMDEVLNQATKLAWMVGGRRISPWSSVRRPAAVLRPALSIPRVWSPSSPICRV